MAGKTLHLLVILLAFSHLLSLNAVPTSRTRNLLHDTQDILASKNNHQTTEEFMEEELFNGRRELGHDYPGSGANDHHTPKPPV
ncbi:hypothetical protein L1049_006437 [Liquidambar formosana]|uniref:Uncharacterized protein n=1 Tax=Liquidambar formosana TaxID=63359 RepID=A0AAP0RFI2_LIQFO